MKKQLLIITILILLTLTIFSVTGNFYWYRTSTGTTTQVGAFPENEKGVWYLLTRTGYDLSNNVDIYGDIAVYRTEIVKVKNHTNIVGDIIVDYDGLINGHTLNELDNQNSSQHTAYQTELILPICNCSTYGPYDKKAVDINDKKKEIKINNNAKIDTDICVPDGYTLFINGGSEINGEIIAPDSPLIRINGNTTVNGKICAPNSTLDINGQAQIKGPIYVYFLTMNNGTIGK